jgi:hypothetical protein
MLDERDTRAHRVVISRVAHIVGRIGLSMSGAMCGTFVAAYLARADIDVFNSVGFTLSMILVGIIGFYLGIDIPQRRATPTHFVDRNVVPVELFSATGTFLATVAALISVYAIVLDEAPQGMWELVVGSWWLIGITMQVGAGAVGRLRFASRAAG